MVMLIWGLAGFFEYFTGIKPIIELQNKAYPKGVQFVHWFLISLAGFIFLIGYYTSLFITIAEIKLLALGILD